MTLLFNLKYSKEFVSSLHATAIKSGFVMHLDDDDDLKYKYLMNLKFEIDKSIYTDSLANMKSVIEKAMEILIITDIENHFFEIDFLLVASAGMLGVMLAYLVYETRTTSSKMFKHLDNYSLLKIWEIHAMLEDIAEEQLTFGRYLYNEQHLIGKYLNFNSIYHANNTTGRVISLQDQYSKEFLRPKFKRNFVMFSTKLTFFAMALNVVTYGFNLLVTRVFVANNDGRVGMEKTIAKLHGSFINVECYFLSTVLYINYGDFIKIGTSRPSENLYARSIEEAVKDMMDIRLNINNYFG